MSAGVGSATHRYNAGTCPGCRAYLWMDVQVDTHVDRPTLTREGKAVANVRAKIVKVSLEHECAGEVER